MVGDLRFELRVFCSQSRRINQAFPIPVKKCQLGITCGIYGTRLGPPYSCSNSFFASCTFSAYTCFFSSPFGVLTVVSYKGMTTSYNLEQDRRIELLASAWKAEVLPLYESCTLFMVPPKGLEPSHLAALEPKSSASTNSAKGA